MKTTSKLLVSGGAALIMVLGLFGSQTALAVAPLPAQCPGSLGDYNIIEGTSASQTLNGTAGNDYIVGNGGADTVKGNGGNDCVVTLGGADKITTGSGDDVILAGGGTNTINAGNGNNKVYTGDGADTITTGSGDDVVEAGGGANKVTTGAGEDTVTTGDGADNIKTQGGNDVITSGAGGDIIDGGTECDIIDGVTDDFACDNTVPEATITLGSPMYISGPNMYITSATPVTVDVVDDFGLWFCEISYTGPGGTTFVKGSVPCPDDQYVFMLVGPDGTYTIDVNIADYGDNTDNATKTVILDNTAPVISIATPADESAHAQGAVVNSDFSCSDAASGVATCVGTTPDGSPIDTATLGAKLFTVNASDNLGNSSSLTNDYSVAYGCNGLVATILGDGGINFLVGTSGDDVIVSLGGFDTIIGNGGNDTICSGDGPDLVFGSNGNDWVDGGEGDDTISGGNDNDTIYGGGGNDIIGGNDGTDSLFGGPSGDVISGGSGNDTIDGGDGFDFINGNSGTDTCTTGENLTSCEI